jgi:hypothetical protein
MLVRRLASNNLQSFYIPTTPALLPPPKITS